MNYKFRILTGILAGVLVLSGCGDRPASDSPDSSIKDKDGDGVPDKTDPFPNDPCKPNVNAPTCDQDSDGIPNQDDEDDDGDGVPDNLDPAPNDPCNPDKNAPTCDQDGDGLPNKDDPYPTNPDGDGDGVPDGQDPAPTDPCVPNVDAPTCDKDGDGIPNGDDPNPGQPDKDKDGDGIIDSEDPDPNDPCVPNVDAPTCDQDGDGIPNQDDPNPTDPDGDGDGVPDGQDPAPTDPCVPNVDAPTCDQDHDQLQNKDDEYPTEPDHDGDGVLDGLDPDYNDPCVPNLNAPTCDQDDDGLINKDDPCPTDSDCDDDGLSDGDEVNKYETDPKNADTDKDDLSDGDEVNKYETDPKSDDTDKDGLKDGEEVNKYKTDPLKPDTDTDGLNDGDEIDNGSDPLKPDTDGDGVKDGDDFVDGKFTGLEPCLPEQKPGYRDYDYTNSIWQAADCDKDKYLNGTEDNVSMGDDHYLSDPYDPTQRCFVFVNQKYCEVDASDGRIWLDRNLGSNRACSSISDPDCYGDRYQWGRSRDGHEKQESPTTNETAKTWPFASEEFITSSTGDHDWLTDSNGNGAYVQDRADFWQGNKTYKDLNSVCPKGWYVPTIGELQKLTKDDIREKLIIPLAGRRDGDAVLENGSSAFLWSSSISNDSQNLIGSWALHYDSNDNLTYDSQYRVNGYSVRCIKKKSISN